MILAGDDLQGWLGLVGSVRLGEKFVVGYGIMLGDIWLDEGDCLVRRDIVSRISPKTYAYSLNSFDLMLKLDHRGASSN